MRTFVYHESMPHADALAALLWKHEFECWPFSRIEPVIAALATHAPQLAVLQFKAEGEALRSTLLMATLCPECRFFVFANVTSGLRGLSTQYRRGANFEIFLLTPSPHDVLRVVHKARTELLTRGPQSPLTKLQAQTF